MMISTVDGNEDISIMNISVSIYNFIKNNLTTSTIYWLVILSAFALLTRFCIQSLLTHCMGKGIHYMPRRRPIEVIKYFNPFQFYLHASNSSYSGIECTVSSTTDCYIFPIWGIPIYDLLKICNENKLCEIKQIICDFAVQAKCMAPSDLFVLPADQELKKEFKPPGCFDAKIVEKSHCPRLTYPFALLMLPVDLPKDSLSQIVLLANIIHIQDPIVKLPTQLYQQYVRSLNGYTAIVRKIYTESFEAKKVGNESVELCVVCMLREISVVVLPCGHACLCQSCFKTCENCPICRGSTHYYFLSRTVSQS